MKLSSSNLVMKTLVGVMIASGLNLTACARKTLPTKASADAKSSDKQDAQNTGDIDVQNPDANPTGTPTTAPNPDATGGPAPSTEEPSPLSRYTNTQYTIDLAALKKIYDAEKINLIVGYKNADGSTQLETLESLAESKTTPGTYPDLMIVNLELRLVALVAEQLAIAPTASQEVIQNAAKAALKASLEKVRAATHALLFNIDSGVAPEGMDPNVRASEITRLKNLLGVVASKDLKDQIDLWSPTAPAPANPTTPVTPTEPTPTEPKTTEPNPVQPTEPASGELTSAGLETILTQARSASTDFSRILLRKTSGEITATQYEDLRALNATQAQNFGSNKIQYEVSNLRLKAAFDNAKKSATAGLSEEQLVEAAQKSLKAIAASAATAYEELEKALAGKTSRELTAEQLKAEQTRAQVLKAIATSPDTTKAIEALK